MKINEYFDRVVVINLDRRPDRMEILGPQLDELGIQYERFSAIDGKERGISPVLAGKLSHVEVLKGQNGQKVLILEDDANFVDDFNKKFLEVMQTLPEDWDIFYLGALLDKHTGKVERVNDHWHRQVVSTGTQAYCVNPSKVDYFIEKQLEWDGFVDVCYRVLASETNAYITQPNLVTQFPSYSDLREREVDDF
jgi:GR25 family glycosyltransferase involved in LPS biosynthesis